MLYVHMVPHTHDDVGWLKTVDEYFSGFDATHNGGVSMILDSVFEQLIQKPHLKFTYAEMKYFSMWFYRQTKTMQDAVKNIVKQGRFEFLNGGWTANDENCPNYEDILNNIMIGHQFLKKEFDYIPRIAWLLDSFGHSAGNARLYADIGFDAIFFARMDRPEIKQRFNNSELDFIWRPFSKNFGMQHELLVSVFRDGYSYPKGFFIEAEEPFQPDKSLNTFNADQKSIQLINYIQKQARQRRSNHLMLPWGSDFTFSNAKLNFDQMDKIISYVNEYCKGKKNITLKYSTPSEYVQALRDSKLKWPTKYDDDTTFSDNKNDMWTGYYSSKAYLKKEIRDSSNFFHASQKLLALKVFDQQAGENEVDKIIQNQNQFLDILGVVTHHDAITGTEKERVAQDYSQSLKKAININNYFYENELIQKFKLQTGYQINSNSLKTCIKSKNDLNSQNIDQQNNVQNYNCLIHENQQNKSFISIIHNPSPQNYNQFIRIKVPNESFRPKVWDQHTKQFLEHNQFDVLKQTYYYNKDNSKNKTYSDFEMFINYEMKPNEIAYFEIYQSNQMQQSSQNLLKNQNINLEMLNDFKDNQVVFRFENKLQNISQTFGVSLKYYSSQQNKAKNNEEKEKEGMSDGAYLFVTDLKKGYTSKDYSKIDQNIEIQRGKFLTQWTAKYFDQETKQKAIINIRYSESNFQDLIEFDVNLNSVPVEIDKQGKDITVNWHMFDNFEANKTFWTDSNGLEMQERRLNWRPSYMPDTDQNISSNYYPVNSAIVLRDLNKQNEKEVVIMNDRIQGGSAEIQKSTVELLQVRRLREDDERGVDEVLNEKDSDGNGLQVNARYYMQIYNRNMALSKQRQQQIQINNQIQSFYSFDYSSNFNLSLVQQAQNLDNSNQLEKLSFNGFNYQIFAKEKGKILLRLENLNDQFNNRKQIQQINIKDFAQFLYDQANGFRKNKRKEIEFQISELNLSGNQLQKQNEKFKKDHKWVGINDDQINFLSQNKPNDSQDLTLISLEPQRIRFFEIALYNQNIKQLLRGRVMKD